MTYDTYDLGRAYPQMPIPLVSERCIDVAAGPITFVVESRDLADSTTTPDAFGGTVHVVAAADSVEYLRFDCFDDIPHYHYLRPPVGTEAKQRAVDHRRSGASLSSH
jgi:hypothetical protein